MNEIFESILSVSFSGSILILVVIAARLLLRKAPRSAICLLWVMVGLRLLLPFRIESNFSLQPEVPPLVSQAGEQLDTPPLSNIQPDSAVVPDNLPPDVSITYNDNAVTEPVIRVVDYGAIAAGVWAVIVCGVVGYTVISYGLLKRKVRGAVPVEDGVLESAAIDSPFLLGYIKPAIFLPKGLDTADRPYILAHERGHMERGDNWIKLIGFLCVGLHWFNPLVWLGYHLLCKDIEMACDEYVVKYMDLDSRKGYSAALVNCSTTRRFGACPVAFGEVSVKQRVLSVLHYRKPGFWISLACIVVIGIIAGCFLTSPASQPEETTPGSTPSDEHAQIIEQCKRAYLQAVGSQTYHIEVDTKYESNSGIMDYSTETKFLRNGDDWYREGIIHEQNFDETVAELGYGGAVYKRSYENASMTTITRWTATNDSAELYAPWTVEIDWNRLTYHEAQGALGSLAYSFLLDGKDDNIITFCLSPGGRLASILHHFDLVTDMDTISHVTVDCQFTLDEAETIASSINDWYLEATGGYADEEEILQKCENALRQLQSVDTYYLINTHESNDPDDMLDRYRLHFWRSGADQMQRFETTDWENWYLQINGTHYRKDVSQAVSQEELSYPDWTEVGPPEEMFFHDPVIMTFQWDEQYVRFVARGTSQQEEIITLSLSHPDIQNPYQVTFRFNKETGMLYSIRFTSTYESVGMTCTNISTFEYFSFDEEKIKAEIQKYYLETQLQTISDETD